MRRHGPAAAAFTAILIAPFFALTVELLDSYAPSPGATLAVASESAPATPPLAPQADFQRADPQAIPATFTSPQPSQEQAPRTQPSVDFNYRYTPGG